MWNRLKKTKDTDDDDDAMNTFRSNEDGSESSFDVVSFPSEDGSEWDTLDTSSESGSTNDNNNKDESIHNDSSKSEKADGNDEEISLVKSMGRVEVTDSSKADKDNLASAEEPTKTTPNLPETSSGSYPPVASSAPKPFSSIHPPQPPRRRIAMKPMGISNKKRMATIPLSKGAVELLRSEEPQNRMNVVPSLTNIEASDESSLSSAKRTLDEDPMDERPAKRSNSPNSTKEIKSINDLFAETDLKSGNSVVFPPDFIALSPNKPSSVSKSPPTAAATTTGTTTNKDLSKICNDSLLYLPSNEMSPLVRADFPKKHFHCVTQSLIQYFNDCDQIHWEKGAGKSFSMKVEIMDNNNKCQIFLTFWKSRNKDLFLMDMQRGGQGDYLVATSHICKLLQHVTESVQKERAADTRKAEKSKLPPMSSPSPKVQYPLDGTWRVHWEGVTDTAGIQVQHHRFTLYEESHNIVVGSKEENYAPKFTWQGHIGSDGKRVVQRAENVSLPPGVPHTNVGGEIKWISTSRFGNERHIQWTRLASPKGDTGSSCHQVTESVQKEATTGTCEPEKPKTLPASSTPTVQYPLDGTWRVHWDHGVNGTANIQIEHHKFSLYRTSYSIEIGSKEEKYAPKFTWQGRIGANGKYVVQQAENVSLPPGVASHADVGDEIEWTTTSRFKGERHIRWVRLGHPKVSDTATQNSNSGQISEGTGTSNVARKCEDNDEDSMDTSFRSSFTLKPAGVASTYHTSKSLHGSTEASDVDRDPYATKGGTQKKKWGKFSKLEYLRQQRAIAKKNAGGGSSYNSGYAAALDKKLQLTEKGPIKTPSNESDSDGESFVSKDSNVVEAWGSDTALSSMFQPPYHLVQEKSFAKARKLARQQKKLLLVSYQSYDEFASFAVNRDVLGDELIQDVIKANFIFWISDNRRMEGLRYANRYGVEKSPHLGLIHPMHESIVWGRDGWIDTNPWTAQDIAQEMTQVCFEQFSEDHLSVSVEDESTSTIPSDEEQEEEEQPNTASMTYMSRDVETREAMLRAGFDEQSENVSEFFVLQKAIMKSYI